MRYPLPKRYYLLKFLIKHLIFLKYLGIHNYTSMFRDHAMVIDLELLHYRQPVYDK